MISDLILIFSPLWIIRKVQLTPSLRFRLLSAFFISIATTVAALIHAILVIRNPGPWEAIVRDPVELKQLWNTDWIVYSSVLSRSEPQFYTDIQSNDHSTGRCLDDSM